MKQKHIDTPAFQYSPHNSDILFSLLQDRNESIASLAMEQILLRDDFEKQVSTHQDSADPMIRRRVHQLENISRRRKLLAELLVDLRKEEADLWSTVMKIDYLYDPKSSLQYLDDLTNDLIREGQGVRGTMAGIAHFMQEHSFTIPKNSSWFDMGHYLLGDVLENRVGVSLMLCIVAQHVGIYRNWESKICLSAGRFCLTDAVNSILDPMENWEVQKKFSKEKMHICTSRDVLLALICQLFSISIINWEIWDIHLFTKLLTAIHGISAKDLPYPIGDFMKPVWKKSEETNKA